MAHLTSVKHDILTANVIKTLKNNNIYNIVDFMKEDSERLCAITKLPFKDVLEIRRFILQSYSSCINAVNYHKNILESFAILPTCILGLDNLLHGGLRCCKITEICGLPDSGKTLLALTISCNISHILKQEVIYIDTKNDFEASTFRSMMNSKCDNKNDLDENLNRVKVVKIWNMNGCLSFLHHLYSKEEMMKDIKLIIVDSLPALVLQYKGDNSNVEYFGYLNNFVNIVRRLGTRYNVPFLVTNLLTRWVDSFPNDEQLGDSDVKFKVDIKPTLGKYWSHIPYVSLDVVKSHGNELCISVRNSNMSTSNEQITVKIFSES